MSITKCYKFVFLTVLTAFTVFLFGCAGKQRKPDLTAFYTRAARHHDATQNPVILIPGVLGSKLVDKETGRLVWGAFTGGYANPEKADGAQLLAIPMRENTPLVGIRDSVVSNGALDRLKIKILGLPVEIGAYVNILGALGVGGYKDDQLKYDASVDYGSDHFTCFQFDYDWRRDNVENARLLHEFILEKRAYVQAEIEKRFGIAGQDVKFDLVAHSMGGLLARYYLRYGANDLPEDGSSPTVTWEGSRFVERAIFVGPPNAGSVDALVQLVQGRKFGFIFPKYEPALLGTLPSLYQLLPRGRHGPVVNAADTTQRIDNFLDPQFWQKMGWGLASPAQAKVIAQLLPNEADPAERQRIAFDHQRKCLNRAKQFFKALDAPVAPPQNLALFLVAGDALPTSSRVAVALTNGKIEIIEKGLGDGTVLRSSALMDERLAGTWSAKLKSPIDWSQVLFVFTEHMEMTKDPAFTDNMLYFLLEDPQ